MFRAHRILYNGYSYYYKGRISLNARVAAGALLIGLASAKAAHADMLPPPGGGGTAEEAANGPEEIVVTARQRKEKAQEVPIPLTVLGGATLSATDTVRIEDIQQRLPSMNVAFLNPRQNSIAVRGLGNNPANDGLEASVGVFLDGVYLGRPGMAIFDFNDIDQIEYLRGPQGTLFGKNTTGGAFNMTTKLPSNTFGGNADITVSNYNHQQSPATGPGPPWTPGVSRKWSAWPAASWSFDRTKRPREKLMASASTPLLLAMPFSTASAAFCAAGRASR